VILISDECLRCKAKERRIDYLEHRNALVEKILRRRIVLTENKFRKLEKNFTRMEKLCLAIFRENPEVSYTYEAFQAEFRRRHPTLPTANLPRRIRQLYYDEHLRRQRNSAGKRTYSLNVITLREASS